MNLILGRGWDYVKSQDTWVYSLSEAVLSGATVAKSKREKFTNLVTLLERGFKPSVGGKWRKDDLFVDARVLDMTHDKFIALLRQRQREHWLQTKGEA